MSKKFGKFILAATAVTTAAAAAYYFTQKKKENDLNTDEDFDDFSEDEDENCSYVELDMEGAKSEADTSKAAGGEDMVSKAAATISNIANKIGETTGKVVGRTIEKVEEFFDDEDDAEGEENTSSEEGDEASENTGDDAASEASENAETDAASEDSKDDEAAKVSEDTEDFDADEDSEDDAKTEE